MTGCGPALVSPTPHIVLCEAQRAMPGHGAQEVSLILTGEAQESHGLRGVGGDAEDPGD